MPRAGARGFLLRKKGSIVLHEDGRRGLRSENHITVFLIHCGLQLYSEVVEKPSSH